MKKINFMSLLLGLGIIPVLVALIISTIFSINKLAASLEDDVYNRLTTATTGLKEYYYSDLVVKGDVELDNYVDGLKDEGIELTLFKDNTRISTSIFKDGSTTERNVGTTADEKIYEEVKSGKIVKKNGVTIGGSDYYVVYQPIYDANGEFWGMSFAGEKQESVEKTVSNAIRTLMIVFIILIIIPIAIIIVISLSLKKPMISAASALDTLASGNLSESISVNSPIKEISNMINSTQALQDNLSSAIGEVKNSATILGIAVAEVDEKVDATAYSVDQINSAINEVACTSQTVSENAQRLSLKAEDLGINVGELTNNSNVLTESSKEIKQANIAASEYMKTVLDSSNQSVQAVNDISQEIMDTNDAVKDIQSCVSMINEIASETKLLSLNASIEAARAGEQGRGFAVVAQNIKSLAESSSDNVKKITDIINRVTKLSEQSVRGAEKVKNIIEEEQKYIIDTQNKFDILSNAVDNSIIEIDSITKKTKALDTIKFDLINATSELGAISEELGASAEEVSATCESVNEMCRDNRAKTQEMRSVNETLTEAVRFFN